MTRFMYLLLLTTTLLESNIINNASQPPAFTKWGKSKKFNHVEKLTKENFHKYVKKGQEIKKEDPKEQLANILIPSQGSIIKGLPAYTSKILKEIHQFAKKAKELKENYFIWITEKEIINLLDNYPNQGKNLLKKKIDEIYSNEPNPYVLLIKNVLEETFLAEEQLMKLAEYQEIPELLEESNKELRDEISKLYQFYEEITFDGNLLLTILDEVIESSLFYIDEEVLKKTNESANSVDKKLRQFKIPQVTKGTTPTLPPEGAHIVDGYYFYHPYTAS